MLGWCFLNFPEPSKIYTVGEPYKINYLSNKKQKKNQVTWLFFLINTLCYLVHKVSIIPK